MIKAILVCTQGMSTNIMKGKIIEAAELNNVEIDIKAIGLDELDNHLKGTELVILGPQIKYAESMIRKQLDKSSENIELMNIAATDFGMMRGDLVFEKIMALLSK